MTAALHRQVFPEDSRPVADSGPGAISLQFIQEAMTAARLSRAQADEVLARGGVPVGALGWSAAAVTPDQFSKIWRAMAACTGDELFGLDPRGMPLGSFAVLGQAALGSATLECAIDRSLQFLGVLLSDFKGRLVRRDGRACIELAETGDRRPALFHLTLLLMITGFYSWLVDRRIVIDTAAFRAAEPREAGQYRRLLCEGLRFDAELTAISFDAKFLAMRPHRNEAQLQDFLERAPRDLLTQYRNCDSLPGRIWQKLRETPPDAWPSFTVLANFLNTTPSTLRRRLDYANNSYQKLKDGVRQELAMDSLRAAKQPIAEIAKELGYEDPSAFYRAFKKWTGLTPNAYRGLNPAPLVLETRRGRSVAELEPSRLRPRTDSAWRTRASHWPESARG